MMFQNVNGMTPYFQLLVEKWFVNLLELFASY